MADYTQARRLMAVSTPLGEDALLLTGFRARAGLSELFQFDLELLAENHTRIDFGQLLGQEVTVRITPFPETQRYFSGIVTKLVKGKRDELFTSYRAEVRPRLWLLTQNVQSRVFQQVSVPDILRKVLGKVLTAEHLVFSNLNGAYSKRDYCVQYRESDFAFASRLMEEEGISYYFRHSEAGHQMVITDTPFDKLDPIEAKLAFDHVEGVARAEPRITAWEVCQEVRPQQYVVRDHSFQLPDQDLEVTEPIRSHIQVGTVGHDLTWGNAGLEIYDHNAGYGGWFDGVDPGGADQSADLQMVFENRNRVVKLRIEAEAAQAVRVDGAGTCAAFHPGFHFELTNHPDGNGAFLIRQVEHVARLAGFRSGEDWKLDYHNSFSCLPKGLPYRPARRTPKPAVAGTQTAVVVGPKGQEIFVDKYGRIKLQFHWDREGKNDSGSSCWVRVAQVWAGNGWGAFFWPRIGQEVVVSFEEGDPDRPIVVGSVYNEENRPPLALPQLAAVNGFKSCSTPGGDPVTDFNGILFDDRKGQEHVQIHSEGRVVNHNESSQLQRMPGSSIQIIGNLPMPVGSGQGTGPGNFNTLKNDPVLNLFKWGWEGALSVAEFAKNFVTGTGKFTVSTVNNANSVLMGTLSHDVIGSDVRYSMDPFGVVLNQLMPLTISGPTPFSFLRSGLMGSNGAKAEVMLGDSTYLRYLGTNLTVTRGMALTIRSDTFGAADAAVKALTALLTLSIITGNVLKLTVSSASETVVNQLFSRLCSFGIMGLPGRLLSLLITLEKKNACLQSSKVKLEEAKELLASVTELLTEEPDVVDPLLDAAKDRTKESLGISTGLSLVRGDGDTTQVVKGAYNVSAKDITLRAKAGLMDLSTKTSINIHSLGGGEIAENGAVSLQGTGQVVAKSGPAMVGVRCKGKKGRVLANCGPLGSIELRRGPLIPQLTARIKIDQGVTIDGGGDPAVMKNPNAKITVDLGTVEIQAASIKLTAVEGIEIGLPGNTLKFSPAGVNLDCLNAKIKSEVQTQIQALQVVQQGRAPSRVGAPIINFS